MAWPLTAHYIEQRQELDAFQVADERLQSDLVRAYLEHELDRPQPVVAGRELAEILYFDTKGAALCSLEQPAPCDELELRSAEREGALVDAADLSMPVELQRLLDRITSRRTYNVDPRVAGITTVGTSADKSFEEACAGDSWQQVRLLRISKAAVDPGKGLAIALALNRYCDNSSGMHVVKFRKRGAKWLVTPPIAEEEGVSK